MGEYCSRKLGQATLSFELLNASWTLRSYQIHFTAPECPKPNWTLKFYVSILEVKLKSKFPPIRDFLPQAVTRSTLNSLEQFTGTIHWNNSLAAISQLQKHILLWYALMRLLHLSPVHSFKFSTRLDTSLKPQNLRSKTRKFSAMTNASSKEPRRFAPLKAGNSDSTEGPPKLKGIVFDVDGTLWSVLFLFVSSGNSRMRGPVFFSPGDKGYDFGMISCKLIRDAQDGLRQSASYPEVLGYFGSG